MARTIHSRAPSKRLNPCARGATSAFFRLTSPETCLALAFSLAVMIIFLFRLKAIKSFVQVTPR